ncbi:MAG: penicillin-binding protein 2 [Candidatus Omnitrophota bacterium]
MRAKIVNIIVILLFLLIGIGCLNLSVIQGRKFRQLSNKNCIRLLPQMGARGRILDRNEQIIADNYLTYDVMILPQDRNHIDNTLLKVSKILNTNLKDLRSKFKSGYLAPFLPVCLEENTDIKKAIALEELKPDLDGLIIQPHPLRRYPYGSLAAHVIGYLDEIDYWRLTKLADYGYNARDIVGFGGVEEKYDYFLRQEEGALSIEVDHRGKSVRVLGYKPPRNGKDIQLTIDVSIQKIVENNLGDKRGSVVIMEPYTGEIIALANSPDFDPAVFIAKKGSDVARLFNNSDAPLLNRAISGLYPPASVFKIIVASGALDTGKINSVTSFSCGGKMLIGGRQFACWDIHYQEDLLDAIAHSCDVFFYHTGMLLGAQLIHDYALKFGLSQKTAVDLPYEAGGFVPSPLWKKISMFQGWFDGDTANFSIGQGDLLVTPLQIARATAVFANGGILVPPHVVKNISGYDLSEYHIKKIKVSLKPSTFNYIRQGLRKVVRDFQGTANVLSGLKVEVAGKTGTAQVSRGQPHAWFAGYFPYKNPRFVITVLLENGGSGYAACVLTKQIIEEMTKESLI